MNGNMFDELRKLAETEELSQDAVNRLTLSALAEISHKFDTGMCEINQKFSGHVEIEEKRSEGVLELRDSVEELSEAVTLLSQSVIDLNRELISVKTEVKSINDSPFVVLGRYIKTKPKQSILWGIGIFVGVYLIMGFRVLSLVVVLVGSLLGLPQESIEWILNWMGK